MGRIAGLLVQYSSMALVSAHSPERVHAAHATAKSRSLAVKARANRRTDMQMIHLMKMVEVRKVVKMIHKDKTHARTEVKRRPPIPGIGIGIDRDRVHKHAPIRAFNDLPVT